MATKAADKKETPEPPPIDIPPTPATKAETRLFQDGPGNKVWLTKEQATKAGKFWAD